ncbi:MAG: lipocalin family protein [Owenweeksia sp.]
MKKLIALGVFLCLALACGKGKNDNSNSLKTSFTGTYQLKEVLADPGDGSGTFQPVTSSKTITFTTNGTVSSNGDLCNMSVDSNTPTSGTYSLADSSITVTNCMKLYFEVSGNELIINYPCIEPCRARFTK